MELNNGIETFYAKTRKDWRKWLEKNGQSKQVVCLILFNKDSEAKSVSYTDAVEEALCYGWIDSKVNKRDPESRYQQFTPRKPNSNWSKYNVARVEKLIEAGLMTPAGQLHIDAAKKNGKWVASEEI